MERGLRDDLPDRIEPFVNFRFDGGTAPSDTTAFVAPVTARGSTFEGGAC